jgi:hypothetical protein
LTIGMVAREESDREEIDSVVGDGEVEVDERAQAKKWLNTWLANYQMWGLTAREM